MALRATQRLLSLSSLLCLVSAITNSQELARYQQLSQFRTYPDELTRSALSPQQQTHILSDVQHRFLVNPSQRQQPPQQQQHFQGQRPTPQQQGVDFGAIRQQVQQQYSTLPGSPSQPGFEPQPANYQPFPGQAFPNYQPQPALHNYNFNFPQQTLQQQQQPERKPVVLQPTYSKEDPTVHHQQQAPTNNYRQPSYRPQQPTQETYQQQFENYVVPEKQKDFISQVDPPKYSPEPEKQETPSWVLETQPPNLYKTQKPYDAITFATESYKVTTAAPRFVKYRPKAKPTEATKDEETSPLYIKHDRKKLYDQLVSSQSTARPRVTSPSTTASPPRSTTAKSSKSEEELLQEELQRQIQAQLSGKDDVFGTLKITLPGSLTSEQIANLPNLALGDKIDQYDIPTVGANGLPVVSKTKTSTKASTKPKTQVKTIVINQPTTTVKPPTVLFEELTKGVLPPGADFEVIRQKQDGGLEEVGKLKDLAQKKVTFVILEEQPDGSVKVQGVRGNEDGPTETKGEEVDSIIQKIQKGEIKLPPSAKKQPTNNTPDESVASPSYVKHVGKSETPRKRYTTKAPTAATTKKYKYQPPTRTSFLPTPSPTTERPAPVYKSTTTSLPPSFAETHFHIGTRTTASYQQPSASNSYHQPTASNNYHQPTASTSYQPPTGPAVYETPTSGSPVYQATPAPSQYSSLPALYNSLATATGGTASTGLELVTTSPSHFTSPTGSGSSQLTETLKKHGFYAMAKFLRQSGLETVLNETGPYTLFVPTDKAFRSLLVQLGGPDRAEIKFKENPRLLSGLLLHHVIPGSFKLESLQDEMTGVSLAGTQLRVNTYVTQDQEWNDVKTTTINGAKVLRDMSDVVVPQGLAHGVDRVMFPLPVGDILQTLQADREGRFSKFVKLLRETGVATMFTGSKTYTVFAPTDSAFPDGEVERLLENRANARALVLRHVTPGTLYSAGMLFYQLRDSMMASNQIQLSKEAGRVKVNNAQVVSRNIPTTNGVIHAVDTLL